MFLAVMVPLVLGPEQGRAESVSALVTSPGGNLFPFGTSDYSGLYEQVYSSSVFSASSGPVNIDSIDFMTYNASGLTGDLNLTLSLGVTSATPSGPGSSYTSTGLTEVYSNSSFTFTGQNGTDVSTAVYDVLFSTSPFLYDPSLGNLVLQVKINSVDVSNPLRFLYGTSTDTGRIYNSAGSGPAIAEGNHGLQTRFEYSVAAVPEPGTFLMAATGLLMLIPMKGLKRQFRRGERGARSKPCESGSEHES